MALTLHRNAQYAIDAIAGGVEGVIQRRSSKREAALNTIKNLDLERYGPDWGYNPQYFATHTVCANCHLMFNVVHDETSDHCVSSTPGTNGHVHDQQLHAALIEWCDEKDTFFEFL